MNRQILFRGKRKDNCEWVYGGIVHQTDYYGKKCDRWFIIDGTNTHDNDIGYEYEVIAKTVGQYTGLEDKNGTKIFNGDIVKLHGSETWEEFHNNCYIGIIEWAYEGWILRGLDSIPYVGGFFLNFAWHIKQYSSAIIGNQEEKVLEVIGNAFDNPELLEDK